MVISTFEGKVVKKKKLTDSVILLSMEIPEDFTFKAGQFVSLVIEKDGERKLKSYSILNKPSQKGLLDLCIKIIDGGFASEVFRETKEGDVFEIKGPFGHFVFDENDSCKERWFLGAGTGVAPLHCMITEFVEKCDEKFVLLFGVRRKEDLFLHDVFLELAAKYDNFEYKPVLSREEWDGLRGHVQDNLPEDLHDKTFYVCGLKELVVETKELLAAKGVSTEAVKSERYS